MHRKNIIVLFLVLILFGCQEQEKPKKHARNITPPLNELDVYPSLNAAQTAEQTEEIIDDMHDVDISHDLQENK